MLDTGVLRDGPRALQHARERRLFGSTIIGAPVHTDSHHVVEVLTRRFERFCPRGLLYTTDAPPPAWLHALSNRDKRRILTDAVAFARDFRPVRQRSPYDVTALAVGGAVRIIFVQDARTDRQRRGRWRALVRDANVATGTTFASDCDDP